jgi:hypothetical protein
LVLAIEMLGSITGRGTSSSGNALRKTNAA